MNDSASAGSGAADATRRVAISYRFDAPRPEVFAAFTEPARIAQWWGPRGFFAPADRIEVDLRPGGRLDVIMVLASDEIAAGMGVPVGAEFPDCAEIIEVIDPELLVLRSAAQPEIGLPVPSVTRIEFHVDGTGTRVELTGGPYTPAMAPHAETGWRQSFDKLSWLLTKSSRG